MQHAAASAAAAAASVAAASPEAVDGALGGIAARLEEASDAILQANRADVSGAEGALTAAMIERLRLDEGRLDAIGVQLRQLAQLPPLERVAGTHVRPDGVTVQERRVPIGVVGANFEARANVTVDIASQLLKSGNAGVLRTGGAALRTAAALIDRAVAPALADAGIDPGAVQLVRSPDREAAWALVRQRALIPLVILRGSGETTAALAREAAEHGVRTLAHAAGGGVLYVHPSADRGVALALIERSLDRLGVCNRLNLLMIDAQLWDAFLPAAIERLEGLGVAPSLPPHQHDLGHEWALDDEAAATVTVVGVEGPARAAELANEATSRLAAGIVAEDAGAASEFLARYRGTGAFWNVTTRLLDGYELLGAPETGINVDHVPGPRGPVTYRDLYLRQYLVLPAAAQPALAPRAS